MEGLLPTQGDLPTLREDEGLWTEEMYRLLRSFLLSENPGGGRRDLQGLSSQRFRSRGSSRNTPQVLSLCLWQAEGYREDEGNVSQTSGAKFQFRTELDKGPRFILECHTVPPIVKYKLLFLVRYVCNANQSVGNSSKNSSAIDLHPKFWMTEVELNMGKGGGKLHANGWVVLQYTNSIHSHSGESN